jgi:hypothetical protein
MDMCACMGPLHGDPYCYCEMQRRGLNPNKAYEWTPEKKEKLSKVLDEIFNRKNND